MPKLSDTALVLLNKAATREDRLVEPPKHLPAGARYKVVRSLLKQDLLIEIPAELRHPLLWRTDEHGQPLVVRLTDKGFRALNMEPPGGEPAADTAMEAPTSPDMASVQAEALTVAKALEAAHDAPVAASRASLHDAAAAVLERWDDRDNQQYGLPVAIEHLRAALAAKPRRPARVPGVPHKQREGTKQQAVLAMLRRESGATVAQIAGTTGWASHTVRGFLAGLKKKGIQVSTLDRVRMVGPNKEGTKRSFTIYHVAA